ncbi:MAG: class II aldolase/adducin family protein [Myxococcota bacterium]
MVDEGVIKFSARHETRPLDPRVYGALACTLVAWREILALTGLVGQDPSRYGGAGFGNVSARVPPFGDLTRGRRRFIVSGTQTGGLACISLRELCVVEEWRIAKNEVRSFGEIMPSSEAMTHGAIYDLAPELRAVLHAHTPLVWQRARPLGIPATRPDVAYGTPEMAGEVERLWRETAVSEARVFAMGGHQDGVVAFGRTADDAGATMMRCLARAYAAACFERGAVCAAK